MEIAQKKPSDFIKPGDYVIFPADSRGIRLIKIVPELGDNEGVLAYWLQRGAEPFTGEVPKSGYVFEKRAEEWDPEDIDDKNWDPRPMSSVPQKVKTFGEAMRDGNYEIGVYQITCTRCDFKRETHARSVGKKDMRYEEQFCSRCELPVLHSIQKIKDEEVMLPPAYTPGVRHIAHHEEGPVKITWLEKLRSRISLFSQWGTRVLEKMRGIFSGKT